MICFFYVLIIIAGMILSMKDIATILTAISQIAWSVIVGSLVFYFAKPIRRLLEGLHFLLAKRGLKVTTKGIQISTSFSKDEEVSRLMDTKPHPWSWLDQEDKIQKDNVVSLTGNKGGEDLKKWDNSLPKSAQQAENLAQHHGKGLLREINKGIDKVLGEAPAEDSQTILRNMLADSYICLYFERCFHRLLSSHLQFLMYSHQLPESHTSKNKAKNFYTQSHLEGEGVSFDEWFKLLVSMDFVEECDNGVKLTNQAQEFLHYIRRYGYLR